MSNTPPEQLDFVDSYDALSQLASLHYADLARDAWPLALLRAQQLGVTAVVAHVALAWHAGPGGLDLHGATHPQRDLLGLLADCARVGLGAIVALSLPAELARGQLDAWLADLTAALGPSQSPDGPIVALYLAGSRAADLEQPLRAAGWHVPLMPCVAALDLNFGAGRPLLRADGSARMAFWRAKLPRMLMRIGGDQLGHAHTPADLALLVDGPASADPLAHALAARLRAANIACHQLELAHTTSAEVARYTLVIASQSAVRQPSAVALGPLSNLALLGDGSAGLPEAFCYKPRLPAEVSADQVTETLEALGGRARYAWADRPMIGLDVRYGQRSICLAVQSYQPATYHGMLAYRARDGAVLHLQVGLGGGRSGVVLLRDDEVIGAAIDGDGAEGGWFTRSQQSSFAFNNGPGALIECGTALIASAAQSGRFQARRPAGWQDMSAYRLLLNGVLLPAELQIDGNHLTLPYLAEDVYGQTDCYLALVAEQPLPAPLRAYLAGLLRARAAALWQWARLAASADLPALAQAGAGLRAAAEQLEAAAEQLTTLAAYERTWALVAGPAQQLIGALAAHEAAPLDAAQRLASLPGWLLA